jgi:hypothetical protein
MTWEEAIDVLAAHAVTSLPDSIAARKSLLRAVLRVISSMNPDYRRSLQMLAHLEKHEALQAKLPLKPGHDGQRGDGDGESNKGGKK